jgi:hypothetical protein
MQEIDSDGASKLMQEHSCNVTLVPFPLVFVLHGGSKVQNWKFHSIFYQFL